MENGRRTKLDSVVENVFEFNRMLSVRSNPEQAKFHARIAAAARPLSD
jgi:hypothetical protein